MTLDQFRSTADRLTEPVVSVADRLGFTPNTISILAFVAAILAGISFGFAGDEQLLYLAGAVLVGCNGLLDLVDGALARKQEVSSRAGDLLDHVLDRYADIVIIAGLAAGIGAYAIGLAAVTGVLMTSYLGTQSQAIGLDREYGGLLGRADRLALTGIVALGAAVYSGVIFGLSLVGWLLVVFAIVGHLTAAQRFVGAWRVLD